MVENTTYDPKQRGRVTTIDFTFDLALFQGGGASGTDAVTYQPLIIQNGNYYAGPIVFTPAEPNRDTWEGRSILGLTSADFQQVPAGSDQPDFSGNGGVIKFGFITSNTTSEQVKASTRSGIDNFHVRIVPESAVLPLQVPIAVVVEDDYGGFDRQSFDIIVQSTLDNRAPEFVSEPVPDAFVNLAYSYDADAPDPDGDNVTYAPHPRTRRYDHR